MTTTLDRQSAKEKLASLAEDVEKLGGSICGSGFSIHGQYIEFNFALARAFARLLKEDALRTAQIADEVIATLERAEK